MMAIELPEYTNGWLATPEITLKLRMYTTSKTTRAFKFTHLRPDITADDAKAIAQIMIEHKDIYKYKPVKLVGASVVVKTSRLVPVDV